VTRRPLRLVHLAACLVAAGLTLGVRCASSSPRGDLTLGAYTELVYAQNVAEIGTHLLVANNTSLESRLPAPPRPDRLHDLLILDAGDPTHPRLVGALDAAEVPRREFMAWITADIERQLAFVVLSDLYLADPAIGVIDIADRAHPAFIGRIPLTPNRTYGPLVQQGSLLYAGASYDGLRIFDVSDARRPAEVAHYDLTGGAELVDLVVQGSRVALAIHDYQHSSESSSISSVARLEVLDVTIPANPVLLGSYQELGPNSLEGVISDLEVAGTTAYLVRMDGLRILDIADPRVIRRVQLVPPPAPGGFYDRLLDVEVVGSIAYLASAGRGIVAVDLGDPTHPRTLGIYPPRFVRPDSLTSLIETRGKIGIAGITKSGIQILDLDGDGDGVPTVADNCPALPNIDQNDADADDFGDACDSCPGRADEGRDSDADGVDDRCDVCLWVPDSEQHDADGDGVGDACDRCVLVADPAQQDTDQDHVGDACDRCPSRFDPAQLDSDGDRRGDVCDNCLVVANPDQRDSNADGYGNICDPDLDDDGVVGIADLAKMKRVFFGADVNADLDGDGRVTFADLARLKAFLFRAPGPSGAVK